MSKIPVSVVKIIKMLNNEGFEGYLVGGCVRDLVLSSITGKDITPHDYDLCTNARPEEIESVFRKNHIAFHGVGKEFGTITALMCGDEFEITTYRKESGYSDSRHPDTIEFTNDIREDLQRRDFTINALAYNPLNGDLIDCFYGVNDLKKGRIQAVGNPIDRFNEDGLRVLRALRFAIALDFRIASSTFDAMIDESSLNNLKGVSKERVTAEFKKMLTSGKSISNHFMNCKDVVFTCINEFSPCYGFEQNNRYHQHDVYEHCLAVADGCESDKFEVKLAALLHDIGKPTSYSIDELGRGHFYGHPEVGVDICKDMLKSSFRLTKAEEAKVIELVKVHDIHIGSSKTAVKRLMSKYEEEFVLDLVALKQSDINDHIYPEPDKISALTWMDKNFVFAIIDDLKKEAACLSVKSLEINGYDLMELGLKGKQVGDTLSLLLDKVIDEELPNDKASLILFVNDEFLSNESDIELD